MSEKEVVSLCGQCHNLHPVNGPCLGGGPGACVTAPVQPAARTVTCAPQQHLSQADHLWRELCAARAEHHELLSAAVAETTERGRLLMEARRERDEARAECERLRSLLDVDVERLAGGQLVALRARALRAEQERDEALAALRRLRHAERERAGSFDATKIAALSAVQGEADALLCRPPATPTVETCP